MPFSSSICLTNTGTLPLGSYVDIYSNSDSYAFPFQPNISLSLLTSNCPYILTNIPDGTTEIKFQDIVSHCCYNLIISPNNICNLFGIQLSGFSSTTISEIVAGLLVSSVGANITDYIIDWYGPDDNTTVAFTSGFGTLFGPYNQTHPFTRLSISGYYAPMIRQIRINGINYSITGGTGFVQANTNCLENQTVQVFPSNCLGNRQEPYYTEPQYNNFYFSNSAAFNLPPETLEADFDLDVNTNYFAWEFKPESVSDTIEISFVSDNYSEPIVLDYWRVGLENTESNLLVTPKVMKIADASYFKKVINLKPFLRNQNDKIRIRVIPNITNSRTNWQLYFKCLETFDCSTCLDTAPLPYKFINNSLSLTPLSCNRYLFVGTYTSCTTFDYYKTDLFNYFFDKVGYYDAGINASAFSFNDFGSQFLSLTTSTGGTLCNQGSIYGQSEDCYLPPGGVTTFAKTNDGPNGDGRIYMTFQLLSDLTIYYNSYLNNIVANGLGTPFDNTNINYYRKFTFMIPIIPSTDISRPCSSDIFDIRRYDIHTSSVVTTGFTGTVYWMNMTMPRITKNINFINCELMCDSLTTNYVNVINQNSISQSNQANFVSQIGAKLLRPFNFYLNVFKYNSGPEEIYVSREISFNNIVNDTIPMSGSTYTPIPSLSSSTCDMSTYVATDYSYINPLVSPYVNYQKTAMYFRFKISNPNSFQIFDTIPNNDVLIYDYNLTTSAVTYSASSYFVGPSIGLISVSYTEGENIPILFKSVYCGQQNFSPFMNWGLNGISVTNILSYEILCEDTDAQGSSPDGYFIHWSVTGIDPSQSFITQNGDWLGTPVINPTDYQPGFYTDRSNGWNGPCPPSGTHNYRIQITANLVGGGTIKSNYSRFTSSTP